MPAVACPLAAWAAAWAAACTSNQTGLRPEPPRPRGAHMRPDRRLSALARVCSHSPASVQPQT